MEVNRQRFLLLNFAPQLVPSLFIPLQAEMCLRKCDTDFVLIEGLGRTDGLLHFWRDVQKYKLGFSLVHTLDLEKHITLRMQLLQKDKSYFFSLKR